MRPGGKEGLWDANVGAPTFQGRGGGFDYRAGRTYTGGKERVGPAIIACKKLIAVPVIVIPYLEGRRILPKKKVSQGPQS